MDIRKIKIKGRAKALMNKKETLKQKNPTKKISIKKKCVIRLRNFFWNKKFMQILNKGGVMKLLVLFLALSSKACKKLLFQRSFIFLKGVFFC